MSIKVAGLISAIWGLMAAGLMVVTHLGMLPHHPTAQAVTINEIGDTLAGVVAPLAFLWFFVATTLQRDELALQRRELEETRTVLADQQRELERAAQESAQQTRIMQAREVYEEHRLRTYYLARFIVERGTNVGLSYDIGTNAYTKQIMYSSAGDLTEENRLVDRVFLLMQGYIGQIIGIPDDAVRLVRLEEILFVLNHVSNELSELINGEQYTGNALIAARLAGTNMEETHQRVISALARLERFRS